MFQGRESEQRRQIVVWLPSTEIDNRSVAVVGTVLDEDRHITLREMEAETRIPQTTVHRILTEHVFKKKGAVWQVPYALTDMQEQIHLKIVQEHLKWFRREGEDLLNQIIAVHETRIVFQI